LEDVTIAAPAQPEATPAPALTAVESAVVNDNFTDYRAKRQAERSGTPAPAPAAEPVTETKPEASAPPAEEPRQVSKRQQQINAYERRIAEQDQRIRALEAASATPPEPTASRTEPVAGETFPAYAQYLEKHPDASLEDYIDARQDWREANRTRAAAAQRQETERAQSHQATVEKARERVAAAIAADPTFETKLAPELLTIPTREMAIANRQIPLAENDFASEIAKSEYFPQILLHVSEHPEVLTQIRGLENRKAVVKFVAKLETRFEKAAETAPVVPAPKTISSAPNPGTPLGTRPASAGDPVVAAVQGKDFTAYRSARRAERAARR